MDNTLSILRVTAKYKSKKKLDTGTMVYEYSEDQIKTRNRDKAKRIEGLSKIRDGLVKQVKKDYKSKDLKTRLTALAVGLIDHTYERVGNDGSADEGHFGVTGWQAKHVKFSGGKATISYVGKSGVKQTKTVSDSGAVKLLKEALKGKSGTDPIFTCEDGKGDEVCVTAKEVNEYLPKGITAKDLRGLHANEEMKGQLQILRGSGKKLPSDPKKRKAILKKEFQKALEATAKLVGHEASTLKSQYLVPALETKFMQDGTVIDKLDTKNASWVFLFTATKTEEEKKDEDADKKVRKEPKKKPPRYDLRDNRLFDPDVNSDPDMKDEGKADKDKDLSLNYKRVARRFVARSDKAKTPGAAKSLFQRYKDKNPETKKTWQDFYEQTSDKGISKEDETGGGRTPSKEEEEKGADKAEEEENEGGKAEGKDKDEKKGDGAEDKPEEIPPEEAAAAAEEQAAQEKQKQIKQTKGDVERALKGNLSGIGRVTLPKEVSRYLPEALENLTPEQITQFTTDVTTIAQRHQTTPFKSRENYEDAQEKLDELSGIRIEDITDPSDLAAHVVALTQASAVVQHHEARMKGAKKRSNEEMKKLQKTLRDALGDPRYKLPRNIQSQVQEHLGDLDEKQIKGLADKILAKFKEIPTPDDIDEDVVELAQESRSNFDESLVGETNIDSIAGIVAAALHDQSLIDAQGQREKARKKAVIKALNALPRALGVAPSDVPRSVRTQLQTLLSDLDPEEIGEFQDHLITEFAKLETQLADDPSDRDLLTAAAAAMDSDLESGDPQSMAQQAALAFFGHTKIADPKNLGGTPVSDNEKSPEELQARGLEAFDHYSMLPHSMREKAAKSLASDLKKVAKGTPRHAELSRILDGIALAAAADISQDGKILTIPGRKINEGFAHVARAMVKNGNAGMLLGTASEWQTSDGARAFEEAMNSMTDAGLAAAVKDTFPELAKFLEDDSIGFERRALLRDYAIKLSVDNMTLVDGLIEARMKGGGATGFDDPNVRREFAQRARGKMKSWFEKFLAKITKQNEAGGGSVSPSRVAFEWSQNSGPINPELHGEDLLNQVRLKMFQIVNDLTSEFGGDGNSHSEQAVSKFLETGNSDFLRSEPEISEEESETDEQEKMARISRSKPYKEPLLSADRDFSPRALRSFSAATARRNNQMSHKLLANQGRATTDMLDHIASLIQENFDPLGIPQDIALDFAKRCDLLSDNINRQAAKNKEAYTEGPLMGKPPSGDQNTYAGPPQPFDPAEIGKQDKSPPVYQADEPYMKDNFIQTEFNELSHFQEDGLFSNAKAASKVVGTMIAKLQGLAAALATSE